MPDMKPLEELLLHRVPLLALETGWLISGLFCCQAWLSSLFPTCAPGRVLRGVAYSQHLSAAGQSNPLSGSNPLGVQALLPPPAASHGPAKAFSDGQRC